MSTALLEAKSLSAGYGQANVLHEIDLRIEPGQVVVVLGANGAGKTTLMRSLAGLLPFSGTLEIGGKSVKNARPDQMVRRGVSLVPQGRGTLTGLSVTDNLRAGAVGRQDPGASRRIWTGGSPPSRGWPNGASRSPAPCPVASSRCSPSPER